MQALLAYSIAITIFEKICLIVGLIYISKTLIKSIYYIIENITNKKRGRKYIQKSIKFDTELAEKIKELSQESERGFNNQVKFMLKKYIEMTENK